MSQIAALSLDGGGLLALSELYIIKDLLTRLQHDLDLPSEPLPCDIFDVIGGSGSGGVIAILLGRLHLSIDNAVNIFILIAKALRDELDQYQGFSKKLFRECPNNLLHSLLYLLRWLSGNVSTKKERSKRYQNNLKTHLGEQSNSGMREPNLRCKTFVCAMPRVVLAEGLPVCYRNYRSREDHTFDCSIWEAAYATTAYPKILGAIKIGEGMTSETIVDAGLGFSNPVEIVLDEIESLYSSSDSEICVLSLGVGHGGSSGRSSEDGSWESLLDDIARGCERTAQRFVKMKKKGYFRLNVQQGLQGIRLNDWTNPGDILTHTRSYLKDPEVKARQDQVVELLLRRYRERLIPSPTRRLNPRLAERMAKLRQIRSEDIHPKKEVLVAKGFRFQDVEVDLKPNQRFLVQHFTGSRARENRDRALQLNIQAMHPGLLQVFGKSPDCDNDYIIFYDGEARPAEQELSRALLDSDTNVVVRQGISLIGDLSSALQFLHDQFSISGHAQLLNTSLKDFVVFVKFDGQYSLALTPGHDETNGDATSINVTLLQSVCSETLTQATIVAHRDQALRNKDSFIHEVFDDDVSSASSVSQDSYITNDPNFPSLRPALSHPATSPPVSSRHVPLSQESAVDDDDQLLLEDSLLSIKDETDLRLYSWQKDTSARHSLKSISEDFTESRRNAPIQENIQLSGHQGGIDQATFLCPGYRRDDIRMSLSVRACAIFVCDTPQEGEVCKACGKEHSPAILAPPSPVMMEDLSEDIETEESPPSSGEIATDPLHGPSSPAKNHPSVNDEVINTSGNLDIETTQNVRKTEAQTHDPVSPELHVTSSTSGNGLRLLSFDSGHFDSPGSLATALVFGSVMENLESELGLDRETLVPAKHFDMIAGTGTGGILALFVGPLQMTASEAIQNYVQLHSRVFSVESESKAHRSQALDSEIRSIIEQKLGADGDKTLLSGFKSNKTLVIAMQRVNMSLPVCFRTYRVRSNVFLNPTIAQAAAATIADPRLFDPVFLGPPANEFVHANDSFGNPIEQLLHEAQSTFPGRYISCIISIGARHFGLRSLILPTEKDELAAHALAIGCQRTADALEHKFSGFDSLYFRFNIDQGLQAPLIPLTLSQVVTHVRAHVRTATMNRAIQLVTQAIIERPHICSLDALK